MSGYAGGTALALPRPDMEAVTGRDPRLTEVLEGRRSIRRHNDASPMTAQQLGEFLYRTARTRSTWVQDGVELVDRPYPSGGALRPDRTVEQARDELWLLIQPEVYRLLVGERGWTLDAVQAWLARTASAALLPLP